MATDQKFVDFVLDQIENAGEITAKKMFDEYGFTQIGIFLDWYAITNLESPYKSMMDWMKDFGEVFPHKEDRLEGMNEDQIKESIELIERATWRFKWYERRNEVEHEEG